jgi:DHA1 family bicyclomycin/chloramphenicol resistance-like MFS transporter
MKNTVPQKFPLGVREFIALIAGAMALSALAIDTMLPAFAQMSQDFGLVGASANQIQWVVYAFMLGFSVAQLVYGSFADAYGRKPVILFGLAVFLLATVGAMLAQSFTTLLWMRGLQGVGMAALRVLSIAIVRDRFGGAQMARVMSFVMMVFITVPIVAPSVGQFFLFFSTWHSIFILLLLAAAAWGGWFVLRMPETLAPEHKRPLSFVNTQAAFRLCIGQRSSVVYASAAGLLYGCLMTYLGSSEQLFARGVYQLGERFSLVFGSIAIGMGLAAWLNTRLVERVGLVQMVRGSLLAFALTAWVLFVSAWWFNGVLPLGWFMALVCVCMACFSLTMPNLNALAMQPLQAVAGSAASLIGTYTTLIGVVLGSQLGGLSDGTVLPFALAFLLLSNGACALVYGFTGSNKLKGHQHG